MSASLPLVVARELALQLPDGRTLVSGLTLSVGRERLGLVGPNGSGKSTLLAALAGVVPPSRGGVTRRSVGALLSQFPRVASGARVVELLGVAASWDAIHRLSSGVGTAEDLDQAGGGWDLPERVAAALRRVGLSGLHPLRAADSLSGGEVTRVALAGLLLRDPDLLLLDEPTNHLDRPGREALLTLLEGWEGGLVVASHDPELLGMMDRILELGAGASPHLVTGGYHEWLEWRSVREGAAERRLEARNRDLRRIRADVREAAERQARRNSRGHRSRATTNQSKLLLNQQAARAELTTARLRESGARREDAAAAAVAEARAWVIPRGRMRVPLSSPGLRRSEELLRLVAVGGGPPGGSSLWSPLTLRWMGPVRVAVTGPNGSGKSTFLRLLNGELPPQAGEIHWSRAGRRRALMDQGMLALEGARPGWTVLDRFRRTHPEIPEARAREILDRFLFMGAALRRPLDRLSGGERLRLRLAEVLGGVSPPALLLLDEPTNHLDLEGVEAVQEILAEFQGAVVVASHAPGFLAALKPDHHLDFGSRPTPGVAGSPVDGDWSGS